MESNDRKKDNIGLGMQFRKERKRQGLTQTEVAKASEVGINYYAQIERGEVNPSYEIMKSIAKALKMKSLDIK
jgi:transcriptional regulator with XRE-family HTH domain